MFLKIQPVMRKTINSLLVPLTPGYVLLTLFVVFLSLEVSAEVCDLRKSASQGNTQRVNIKKVIDGDTVRLKDGRLVRFIGINTPEIDHETGNSEPFAEKAREYLQTLIDVQRGSILLQYDSEREDRHGRQLAHVFTLDGKNIQANMIEEGLGVWITVPPNLRYLECYRRHERNARQKSVGVWSVQFREPRNIASLTKRDRGFQWIRGKVTRIGHGKKYTWINLGEKVAARVHKDDLQYFQDNTFAALKNKTILVRGWLYPYKKQLVMGLRHPASMEVANN
ncbi:thermonuclease family protein [Kaarinaea lacus]